MYSGVFISWPMERWGCWVVAALGSLVASIGLAASSLAPNIAVLCVTQGFITGNARYVCGYTI